MIFPRFSQIHPCIKRIEWCFFCYFINIIENNVFRRQKCVSRMNRIEIHAPQLQFYAKSKRWKIFILVKLDYIQLDECVWFPCNVYIMYGILCIFYVIYIYNVQCTCINGPNWLIYSPPNLNFSKRYLLFESFANRMSFAQTIDLHILFHMKMPFGYWTLTIWMMFYFVVLNISFLAFVLVWNGLEFYFTERNNSA